MQAFMYIGIYTSGKWRAWRIRLNCSWELQETHRQVQATADTDRQFILQRFQLLDCIL